MSTWVRTAQRGTWRAGYRDSVGRRIHRFFPDEVSARSWIAEVRLRLALTPEDRALLDFERNHPGRPTGKPARIFATFGVLDHVYYQRLRRIVRSPAAIAYDPVTVKRVLRLIDRRQAA